MGDDFMDGGTIDGDRLFGEYPPPPCIPDCIPDTTPSPPVTPVPRRLKIGGGGCLVDWMDWCLEDTGVGFGPPNALSFLSFLSLLLLLILLLLLFWLVLSVCGAVYTLETTEARP